jgi:NodT family efflux transporter outer membrane factor (OMF) lipoprotein
MHKKIGFEICCGLLLCLISACASVDSDLPRLERELNYDESIFERYQIDEQWWRVYNDPQLDRLVATALDNNLDLAKSALLVNKALYQANILGADLTPEFSLNLEAAGSRAIKNNAESQQNLGGNFGISYELDLWRRLADSASAQEWEFKASEEDRLAARLALINSVVDAYYNLVYLDNAIAAVAQARENYERIMQITMVKYQNGKVPYLEPAQAMQSLLAYETNLLELQIQQENSLQTLRNLLNLRPRDSLELSYHNLLEIEAPAVDLNVPLSALANRPDLRAAEKRLRAAFHNMEAADKSLYPSIVLGAWLSSSSSQARTLFDLPFSGGSIGLNLPFLQYNRLKWQIKISEADFAVARLDFEQALTTALNEVNYYYLAYRQSQAALAKTQEKYQYDLKISSYYQARYENGAAELKDWLNALNNVSNSKLSTLEYRYQLIQLENLIYKAMSGRYAAKE